MRNYRGHIAVWRVIFLSIACIFCFSVFAENIVIENDHFRYEIGRDGKNRHFIDKATGTDYYDSAVDSYCAYLKKDGKEYVPDSVTFHAGMLRLWFNTAGVDVAVRTRTSRGGIAFRVCSVSGKIESLTFMNIPLKLEGMPYEPFAACVLSMNIQTLVRQLPALQTYLQATCFSRFGMKGAEVTLLGVPQKDILPVIRDVMSHAKGVPHSTAGGAWAQLQKEGYGSYLMNFGTLTDSTVDEWIEMCNSLGFNQIDNHGGGSFFRFGDFELDQKKWPGGWEDFKHINQRLHKAGISSIFHTYAFFIDKNSNYVTPVPSHDLGYFNSFTLARPAGPNDDEIIVKESTFGISTITGFFVRNSVTLRIGDELVSFSGVTTTPPYKFTGCHRGVNGTKASAHPADEKAYHLREMFGRFVPGIETPLFIEVARKTAAIVNECDFDGLYFDAIDGSDILDGEENAWYYGTRFIFEVVKHLKHPVGMEMSAMSHLWWHYRSRWQAWDRPVRGYKRFVDIHLAGMKSSEHNHGMWRGNTPLIDTLAAAENGGLLLPLQLGWWGNQTWNPPQVEPTFPDDIEYLACKMIGNNAGLSMLGGTDKKTLDENPAFRRLLPIIKQYEELRQQHYFSDKVRSLLRQTGKEYTLFRDPVGEWNFKPIAYPKHKVEGCDSLSSHWTVNNQFDSQPVRLRIELLMSVKPYNDSSNVVLTGFSGSDTVRAVGVTGGLCQSTERTMDGEACDAFFARNDGHSPQAGSWIKMEKIFNPWLNLEKNQGLGVWVKGDGNGELLNFRVESPRYISFGARGDHFIHINFTGWRYFELVEIESSEWSNYLWPDPGFYVYDSYRHTVQFKSVDKLQLWYNNLPAGKTVQCLIGPVKALPLVQESIENPSVTVNGEKIVFPVKMESGMYLELTAVSDCKLYGPKGDLIREVPINGPVPVLKSGDNAVSFNCNDAGKVNTRVQVTVIGEGTPLEK